MVLTNLTELSMFTMDAIRADIYKTRAQARILRDENNKLVEQLWDIETALTDVSIDPQKHKVLMDEKNKITGKISSKDYLKELNVLLEKIIQLETKIYGHSEINSNSPYVL